jgi:opacity protein-like surface antigen
MKRPLICFGAVTLGTILTATAAQAQYRSFVTRDAGFYWSVDAGATIPQDGHINQLGPWPAGQKLTYDVGGAVAGSVGFAFNQFVTTELQLGGTWNDIDSVEGGHSHDSSFATLPVLANLVLEYPIPQTIVVPYIGAGVGGAGTFFDAHDLHVPVPGGSVSIHGEESDFVFAWQASAGLRLKLNDKMSVGVGYRYLHVDESNYSYSAPYHGGPKLDVGISGFDTHMALLTFVLKF